MASVVGAFLLLPPLLLVGFGVAGALAVQEVRRTGRGSAAWRASAWLLTAAACLPLTVPLLDTPRGGPGGQEVVQAEVLLLLLALSAVLYVPAVRVTLRERRGEPTLGLLLWPPAFLLLVLPWVGVILGYLLG